MVIKNKIPTLKCRVGLLLNGRIHSLGAIFPLTVASVKRETNLFVCVSIYLKLTHVASHIYMYSADTVVAFNPWCYEKFDLNSSQCKYEVKMSDIVGKF